MITMSKLAARMDNYQAALEKCSGELESFKKYLEKLQKLSGNAKKYCDFLDASEDILRKVEALRGTKYHAKSTDLARKLYEYVTVVSQDLPNPITYTTGGGKTVKGSAEAILTAVANSDYSLVGGQQPKHEKGLLCSVIALCSEAIGNKLIELSSGDDSERSKIQSILDVVSFQASIQDSVTDILSSSSAILKKYKGDGRKVEATTDDGKELEWHRGKGAEKASANPHIPPAAAPQQSPPQLNKQEGNKLKTRVIFKNSWTCFNLVRGDKIVLKNKTPEKFGKFSWQQVKKVLEETEATVQYQVTADDWQELPETAPKSMNTDEGLRIAVSGDHTKDMVNLRKSLRQYGCTIRGEKGK